MTLRELRPGDPVELQRLLLATGAFTSAEVDLASELMEIILEDPLQKDYAAVVVEARGSVAGYAVYGPIPGTVGTFDLYWIAVDPAFQGTGVGRVLLEAVETTTRSLGARMLCADTSSQPSYTRTRQFYEHAGYVAEATIRDFYRSGDNRVTYVKRF